jgi:hypothetical protein
VLGIKPGASNMQASALLLSYTSRPFHFSIGCLSLLGVIYIFWIQVDGQMFILQIFSPSVCLFNLLMKRNSNFYFYFFDTFLRLASNLLFSCHRLLSAGITDMYYYAWQKLKILMLSKLSFFKFHD